MANKNVLGPAFALVALAVASAAFGVDVVAVPVLVAVSLVAGLAGHALARLSPAARVALYVPIVFGSEAITLALARTDHAVLAAIAIGALLLPTFAFSHQQHVRSLWSVALATAAACVAFGVRSGGADASPIEVFSWMTRQRGALVACVACAMAIAALAFAAHRRTREALREDDAADPSHGTPYRTPLDRKKPFDRARAKAARSAAFSELVVLVSLLASIAAFVHIVRALPPSPYVATPVLDETPSKPASPLHVVHTSDAVAMLVQPDQSWLYAYITGIDRASHRAVLAISRSGPHPSYSYDVIDYVSGERVERWASSEENAKHSRGGWFHPMTGTIDEDLAHAARIADTLDDKQLGYEVAVSPDARFLIYDAGPTDGHDGDWLWVVDRKLGSKRRIRDDERAGYSPVFSPDSRRIAWHGCTMHGCDYGVYVSSVDGNPHRVANGSAAHGPFWTSNTNIVFTQDDARSSTFHSLDVITGRDRVLASTDVDGLLIDVAPDRGSLLVRGHMGMAPSDKNASARSWTVYRWMTAPFDKWRAEYVTSSECVLVSNDGKLLCQSSSYRDPGRVTTFDLANNDEHSMPIDGLLTSMVRIDDDSVLALHERINAPVEIVRVDLKMIRRAPK